MLKVRTNIKTIDPNYCFFVKKNPTLQSQEDYLPEASRFAQLEELDWAFGTRERSEGKHLATLYLEDISDFIVECRCKLGFSRYAERLGRSANLTSYTKLYSIWSQPTDLVILLLTLKEKSKRFSSYFVFNFGSLPGIYIVLFRSAQWVKKIIPKLRFLRVAVS
jgi:hypothetical protein